MLPGTFRERYALGADGEHASYFFTREQVLFSSGRKASVCGISRIFL